MGKLLHRATICYRFYRPAAALTTVGVDENEHLAWHQPDIVLKRGADTIVADVKWEIHQSYQ